MIDLLKEELASERRNQSELPDESIAELEAAHRESEAVKDEMISKLREKIKSIRTE